MCDLDEVRIKIPTTQAHCLIYGRKTGAWISVQKSTINGMDLGAHEWRVSQFLHYGLEPLDLSSYYDGYGLNSPLLMHSNVKKVPL